MLVSTSTRLGCCHRVQRVLNMQNISMSLAGAAMGSDWQEASFASSSQGSQTPAQGKCLGFDLTFRSQIQGRGATLENRRSESEPWTQTYIPPFFLRNLARPYSHANFCSTAPTTEFWH